MKTKYVAEDLSELPMLSELVTKRPVIPICDVCGLELQTVMDAEYKRYRKLEKNADGVEEWKSDHAYDYARARLEPSKVHGVCERVRKLEKGCASLADSLICLGEQMNESRRPRSILARARHRVGCYLHRLGELVQR